MALGHTLSHGNRQVILVDEAGVALLDASDYAHQRSGAVRVKPDTTRRLMWWLAQSQFDAFSSIHDHWFSASGTTFSGGDDRDDLAQDRYFRNSLEPQLQSGKFGAERSITHLAMVLDAATMDARQVDSRRIRAFHSVSEVQIVGAGLSRISPNSASNPVQPNDPAVARHRDFVPPAAQALVADLRVGIVGCGGLGPIVAENLLRLGVREFVLVDQDLLEDTNLNRWLGARREDVGKPKVELLTEYLRRCEPSVHVERICADVIESNPVAELGTCDLLIGAVDNDAARFWLNRLACAALIPLFDLGVRVRIRPRVDFLSRITPIVPGKTACLECSPAGLLDPIEIAKRFDGLTAVAKQSAGYVADADIIAPSVMGLNTQIAGAVTLEILSYICGWSGVPRMKTSTWSVDKTVVVNTDSHQPDPHCLACGQSFRAKGLFGNIPTAATTSVAMGRLKDVFPA